MEIDEFTYVLHVIGGKIVDNMINCCNTQGGTTRVFEDEYENWLDYFEERVFG